MINATKTLLGELEQQLADIKKQDHNFRQTCILSINAVGSAIIKLKDLVITKDFATPQEEILFFKRLKPTFMARLFYYRSLYKMEMEKPCGDNEALSNYYRERLNRLRLHKMKNLQLDHYINSDDDRLDAAFFIRKNSNPSTDGYINPFYFEADPRFTTNYDYKVARLLACDTLQEYLANCLSRLENPSSTKPEQNPNSGSAWSGSITELTEMLYMLHYAGLLFNGTDLTRSAQFIQEAFGVNLGQYRRTYTEIRGRKTERTKLNDKMVKALLSGMDAADDKQDRKSKPIKSRN